MVRVWCCVRVALLAHLLASHGIAFSTSNHHLGRPHTPVSSVSEDYPSSTNRLPILSYNDYFCCIKKASNMSVYRHKHTRRGEKVVVSALKRQLSRNVLPIHRLDHRTSGALILAFNKTDTGTTPGMLHDSLRQANKTYLALVRGDWSRKFPQGETSITVDRPLLRRKDSTLQSARTVFTQVASLTTSDISCSLLFVQPLASGRSHQIRRHAARDLAMPILGDTQHGDARMNRWWKRWCRNHQSRMFLHCWKIQGMPGDNDIVAPLPGELKDALRSVENDDGLSLYEMAVSVDPSIGMEWVDLRCGTLGVQKEWQKGTKKRGQDF